MPCRGSWVGCGALVAARAPGAGAANASVCDDAGLKDTLTFLVSREVAHQKMFEAALDSLPANFPPGTLPVAMLRSTEAQVSNAPSAMTGSGRRPLS